MTDFRKIRAIALTLVVLAFGASLTRAQNAPVVSDTNYVIGAQDVLSVTVWKEPELTLTVPVRPDGKISMPLLNDVQAAGLTPMQLMAQVATGLKKYIADPQVTVIVTQMNSQRFYLMGEVAHPGAYPLLPGITVLQALSGSGGFTQFADTKRIYVLRMIGGKKQRLPFSYKDVINGKRTDQDVALRAGDTIVIP